MPGKWPQRDSVMWFWHTALYKFSYFMNILLVHLELFIAQISSLSDLSAFHLNIRSMQKHFNELHCLLTVLKHNFYFIGLSEIWLTTTSANIFSLPGYHTFHHHRVESLNTKPISAHEGVTLFIKDTIFRNVCNGITINTNLYE